MYSIKRKGKCSWILVVEAGVLAVEQRVGQRAVAGGRGGGRGTVEVRLPELTPPRPQRPRPGLQAAALGLVEAGGGGAQPAGAVLARVRPAQLQYKPCQIIHVSGTPFIWGMFVPHWRSP